MSGWGKGAASHTPLVVSFTRQGKCGEARSAVRLGSIPPRRRFFPNPVALFSRKKESSMAATLENRRPRAHKSLVLERKNKH